ncbi:MAG TPA: pyruvate dehydrogenase complex dihydrolipoamide acetyltransferase [Spirochaetia bacterium]|nr:pyruvate dehydrogenase complex dihydrolipoamide acetyltransferase [Spirochaetia bacterium]
MAEKVLMLALSPTMEEGTVVKWNKKEGDSVSTGDVLCEVETDKATMDYESIQEGTLLKIIVGNGEGAKVEDAIAIIGEKGEDFGPLLKEIEASRSGEKPRAAQSDAAEAAPAPNGETAPAVGGPAPAARAPAGAAPKGAEGRVKSSPLARAIANESGVDLSQLSGSGPGGRIVKRDVESAARSGSPSGAAIQSTAPSGLTTQEVPVSGKRKIIAQRLAESKFTSPHYYIKISVPADKLVQARASLNARREKKISMNAFLIKFAAEALKHHPMVNSSWQGDKILMFGSIDIGLAVAQKDGLITPVVRDCGSKGVVQIDEELSVLIDKALTGKLKQEEYTGATFTISNLGSFGIEEFTAIINPPGSAILAVGAIKKEPVVGPKDEIKIQTNMKLTLSCDHRVIDGALGANFLKYLNDIIEDPIRVLY